MNKAELIGALSDSTGESKAAVTRMLSGFTETVAQQLKKGNSVTLLGFGTFKPTKRAARTGRNPATGAALKIAAANSVKFSAGAALKASLNPKKKSK